MKLRQKLQYANIGLQGLAIRSFSKQLGQRHISRKLSEIPGVPSKIAQFLSTNQDYVLEHQQVLDPDTVLFLIEKETPGLFQDLIELEDRAQVASLSQVHWGKLKDGRTIAIKIQFPDMLEVMKDQIEGAFTGFEKYGPAKNIDFDLTGFKDFFSRTLLDELDFEKELQNQKEFFDFFRGSDVVVPEVYPEYSSRIILTQSYESSLPLQSIDAYPLEIRHRISEQLIRFQLRSIFELGLVHGDLHLGNWGYDPDRGKVVVYDYGSTLRMAPSQVASLIELVGLPFASSENEFFRTWVNMGFEPSKLQNISGMLAEISAITVEPLREESWKLESWRFSERMIEVLGEAKWWFRLAGPPWFLGLMRSCHGLLGALNRLKCNVGVAKVFSEITGSKSVESSASERMRSTKVLSRSLKVSIFNGGDEIVALEFPASSAAHLRELIPTDSLAKIERAGLSLDEISKTVKASHYAPQILFSVEVEGRGYRVWLE